jgi:hypothetical protein
MEKKQVTGIYTTETKIMHKSYDIHGEMPDPKFAVSPWTNSTIEQNDEKITNEPKNSNSLRWF